MTVWTNKSLTEYRQRLGLTALDASIANDILKILNDVGEDMRAISNVSWIEPAMHFKSFFPGDHENGQ